MTARVNVTVPEGVDYYVRLESINSSGRHIVHYIDPGESRDYYIWEDLAITSIKEIKRDSGHRR